MFSPFRYLCSAAIKRATPVLVGAAAGFAGSLWSAAPAVAQTGPTTTEARYVSAAARMSQVYGADGLTSEAKYTSKTGTGNWQPDLNAEALECWSGRITHHSTFSAEGNTFVRNDTSNDVYTTSSPYVYVFAFGAISVAGAGQEHDARSDAAAGFAFASGYAIFPNGDPDYLDSKTATFDRTVYQPGITERLAASCHGETNSAFPPSQEVLRIPVRTNKVLAQTRNRCFDAGTK